MFAKTENFNSAKKLSNFFNIGILSLLVSRHKFPFYIKKYAGNYNQSELSTFQARPWHLVRALCTRPPSTPTLMWVLLQRKIPGSMFIGHVNVILHETSTSSIYPKTLVAMHVQMKQCLRMHKLLYKHSHL